MKYKLSFKILLFLLPLFIFTDCGTQRVVPITGRKYRVQENNFGDYQMLNMVKADYNDYVYSLGGDSNNKTESARVKRVANNLITAVTDYMSKNGYANELQFYEWEVHLVPAPGEVNATCMPGGKIVVFEGILPVAGNDAGLAAILGHEIGHAIAHHAAEQLTKSNNKSIWQNIGAAGISIAGIATGADPNSVNQVVNGTLNLSNQVMQFVEMKYSRNHEYEADHIGMVLMAMAGYDPREAPKVWERMTQYFGDNQMRILSTHPSNQNRMKKMNEKWMDEALTYYNNSKVKQQSKVSTGNANNLVNNNNSNLKSNQYKVTANVLNVRTSPSVSNSSVLGGLTKGQVVTVTDISNGWGKVNYNGKTGYVSMQYLQNI